MEWVELGRVGAPYGIKGWVHVDSYTDPAQGLLGYRRWFLRKGQGERREIELVEGRPHGDRLVARLNGCEDRDAAATLTGSVIEVERASLPPPGARQYYCADLVGCAVHNLEGAALGQVSHFVEGHDATMMVVRDSRGREHWVLAIPQHLRKVDLADRSILVDWPFQEEP